MTFRKKFKRFRKEWLYTGSLAFLTACFILLVLFTSFIISNADEPETPDNPDIVDLNEITSYFSDQGLDISDYQTIIGDGYTSVNEPFVTSFDYSLLDNLSNEELSMYVRDVDSHYEVTSYHSIWDIYVTSDMLQGLPYIVQYDDYSQEYYLRYFCTVDYDSNYNWGGHLLPVNVTCVNECVFIPANSMVISYTINDAGSPTRVSSISITYDNSGYSTTWSNNGTYYNVTYYFMGESLSTILCNFDLCAILDTYSDVYESPFSTDDKNFYLEFGITPDNENIVKYHPLRGSGDTADGSDDNYLVLDNGDWTFKNSQYSAPYSNTINTGNVYPNGNATFSFDLDEYQLQNTSNFELVYGFEFDLDFNYQNWGDAFGPFKSTSKLLNNKKNYKARFTYLYTDSPELIENLNSFYNNGCSHSFNFKDLFDNLHGTNGTLTNFLSQMKELDSVEYNKFNLTCSVFLDSQNTTSSSGKITEWYNPMSKKGYTIDESGKSNPNPYIPSDEDQGEDDVNPKPSTPGPGGNDPDNPDPGTTTTTSGNGSVNVTVTNNPTFNNKVNGGSSTGTDFTNPENSSVLNFWNVFNPVNLFFGQLIKGKDASVETISNATQHNGWIELMGQIFSFVPASFWTALGTFFVACLGIIVIAFVIRIILDLL